MNTVIPVFVQTWDNWNILQGLEGGRQTNSMIPDMVKIWKEWNIRGFILLSLCLQIFLIFAAPLRKRTKGFSLSLVWLAYLLADWAASFCIGLISKTESCKSSITQNDSLMGFWAPFLLLHLGGPDTITAFALEDNELWLRHMLALIFQAGTTGYVIFLTLHQNTLWFPTALVFLAGLIKYGERSYALYLASINTFRKSMVPEPDPGPNYAKLMEELSSREEARLPAEIIIVPEPIHGPYETAYELEDINDRGVSGDLREVQRGFFFFQKFKGLIVDMIFSFSDRDRSHRYFYNKNAEEAFRVIEIELNFMYESFYTKATVVRSWFGILCRFVSSVSVVSALGLFFSKEKLDFDEFDVLVSYILLCGALALDTMAFCMLIFTELTATSSDESRENSYTASKLQLFKIRAFKYFNEKFLVGFLELRRPKWEACKEERYATYEQLSTPLLYRRWSGSISGYNLLTYCLDLSVSKIPNIDHRGFYIAKVIQRVSFQIVLFVKAVFRKAVKCIGAKALLDQWNYKTDNPFLKELWESIFNEIRSKSSDAKDSETIHEICSARGERVLQKATFLKPENRASLMLLLDPIEVAFDQNLLMWHIATHLCYAQDTTRSGEKEREFSMLLSDYMLYLLIMQPTMMSAVAGIGLIRFQDTCAEAMKFFSKRCQHRRDKKQMDEEACATLCKVPTGQKPSDIKGDRSKSVLFDACRLTKELNKLEGEKWKIIMQVWIELLSYAASHCRPTSHVQLLSKGGELISFVWLLMIQLGLGSQFQIRDGHARAKLIVGKTIFPNHRNGSKL